MKSPSPLEPPLSAGDAADRQSLALLWLAESAPLSAAPADSLTNIRARLDLTPAPVARQRRWRIGAFAGWAAAACLAVILILQPRSPRSSQTPVVNVPDKSPSKSSTANDPASPAAPDAVQPLTDPGELRRQLAEVRAALDAAHKKSALPGSHRPLIQELRPPGSKAPAISQDRILDIFANALDAELRSRVPGDPRELIIESGWANWSTSLPPDTVFRHRHFPKDRWEELGLLQGTNGQYLDPSTNWLWSPDPDTSDYTGRPAPSSLDRTAFSPEKSAKTLQASIPAPPAGYLLSGSDGQTIVTLNNLPALAEGDSLTMTSLSTSGERTIYSLPLSGNTTSEGWNFAGFIPNSLNYSVGGFSIDLQTAAGSRSTILSTNSVP